MALRRLAFLVCLAGSACGLEPDPLLPPLPPGGPLVYVTQGLGPFDDVFFLSADASVDSNLTAHLAVDSWPTWSPDGQSIAFESDRGDGAAIGIYRLTIGVPTVSALSFDSTYQTGQPAWSPIGDRIAFTSNRDGAGNDIYLMDTDGGNVTRLTTDAENSAHAAWSPSGLEIVFASDRSGNAEIWVMDTLGGNAVNLTNHSAADLAPAWSPDGQKIAFMSDREQATFEIWVMDASGANPVRLTPAGDPPCELPQWKPDGTKIAFDCDGDVYTINPDGSGMTQITRTGSTRKAEIMPRWRP